MLQLSNGEYIAGKCGTNDGINCLLVTQERIPIIQPGDEVTFVSSVITPLTTSTATFYTATDHIYVKNIVLTNVTGSDINGIYLYVNGTTTAQEFISNITLKAHHTLFIDNSGFSEYPAAVTTIVEVIGGGGGGGGSSSIYDEVPTGAIDGVNDTFTLSVTPVTGTLRLFLNGQRLTNTIDFTYTGSTITMTTIPYTSDTLIADYEY